MAHAKFHTHKSKQYIELNVQQPFHFYLFPSLEHTQHSIAAHCTESMIVREGFSPGG